MRYALLLVILVGCQSSVTVDDTGTASSTTSAVSGADVRRVLLPRHFDADADAVRQLGDRAAPTLIAIAEDPAEANALRIRATLAMRHQSSDDTKQALVRLTTSALPALRRSSVDSLARAFGARDPGLVIDTCVALRADPDESVQRAASTAEMRARVHGARRPR